MAVIRDNMPAFQLFQRTKVDDALGMLRQHGDSAWVLAGGLDTWDWLKDRVKRPSVVVDLGSIEELREIRSSDSGLEIGAMATLSDIAGHEAVRGQDGLPADSAGIVASPQIRNQGTPGGNVSQGTRRGHYRELGLIDI